MGKKVTRKYGGIEFQKAGGYVVKMCMLVMAFTTQH
ncbi:hypothetical protein C623_0207100 [Bacillus thuringiensis serovar aizawai str. Hu4-2]|nr:hypothetical protein C623_0207100 [Bacillus thuringiensis serovar aizawai str. Hu4-2]